MAPRKVFNVSLNDAAQAKLVAYGAVLSESAVASVARRVLEDWAAGILPPPSAVPDPIAPSAQPLAAVPPAAPPYRGHAKPLPLSAEEKAAAAALRVSAQEQAKTAAMAARRVEREAAAASTRAEREAHAAATSAAKKAAKLAAKKAAAWRAAVARATEGGQPPDTIAAGPVAGPREIHVCVNRDAVNDAAAAGAPIAARTACGASIPPADTCLTRLLPQEVPCDACRALAPKHARRGPSDIDIVPIAIRLSPARVLRGVVGAHDPRAMEDSLKAGLALRKLQEQFKIDADAANKARWPTWTSSAEDEAAAKAAEEAAKAGRKGAG